MRRDTMHGVMWNPDNDRIEIDPDYLWELLSDTAKEIIIEDNLHNTYLWRHMFYEVGQGVGSENFNSYIHKARQAFIANFGPKAITLYAQALLDIQERNIRELEAKRQIISRMAEFLKNRGYQTECWDFMGRSEETNASDAEISARIQELKTLIQKLLGTSSEWIDTWKPAEDLVYEMTGEKEVY